MMQNQKKVITRVDLGKIFSAAALTMYPGKTQYSIGTSKYKFGHTVIVYLFHVKGLSDNKASAFWMWDSGGQSTSPYIGTSRTSSIFNGTYLFAIDRSPVRYKINVSPNEIYKNLEIKKGEEKMIILLDFRSYSFLDGSQGNNDPKKMFGFLVMPIRSDSGFVDTSYLVSVLVFTPKPGLFSEIPPK
ncbi:MAG: hypothetical protein LBB21_01305 [Holosporaceae bacterium]|jgi:hypothetical protein|nr:hypothetical protein [Holosporaceae bacterium]